MKSYGTTVSEDLLALRILKSANLSVEDQKLARGTSELLYINMKDQLKRLFSESNSFLSAVMTPPGNSFPKVEDINVANVPGATSDDQCAFYSPNLPYLSGAICMYVFYGLKNLPRMIIKHQVFKNN